MPGSGRRTQVRIEILKVVVAAGLSLLLVAALVNSLLTGNVAEAKHWTVRGQPCPAVSEAAFRSASEPARQSLTYGGASFSYALNHASCAEIHDHDGLGLGKITVCQFSSPRTVKVVVGQSASYYVVKYAHPITVRIEKGVPSCVYGTSEWSPMS